MIKKTIIAVAILIFVFSTTACAQSNSLGLKASTLGLGLEAERSFSDSIGGRIGVNYFPFKYSGTLQDIEYNVDLKLLSLAALIDWHPFQGGFRISGGVIYNGNEADATAKSAATYDIGDSTYSASQVGTLRGDVDFDDIAPYIGVGWDTSFGRNNNLGFLFELGAIYQGKPKVDLSADGPIASTASFLTDLAKEESNFQSDMDYFKFYPVIAIGVSYRF